MTPAERDTIVDDLLLKHPAHEYTNEQLFDLSFRSVFDVRDYVHARFFPDTSLRDLGRRIATVTRRSRRIWGRVAEATRRVQRYGGKGIWAVKDGYRSTLGHVYAEDKRQARADAQMFFGYLTTLGRNVRVEFFSFGAPEALFEANKPIRRAAEKELEQAEEMISWYGEKAHRNQAILDAADLVAKHTVNFLNNESEIDILSE